MDNKFEREVLERLIAIETKLDDYKEVKKDTAIALALSQNNEKDICEINEKLKWITRTIAGALITGLIGIVFILLKLSMGIN